MEVVCRSPAGGAQLIIRAVCHIHFMVFNYYADKPLPMSTNCKMSWRGLALHVHPALQALHVIFPSNEAGKRTAGRDRHGKVQRFGPLPAEHLLWDE